MFNLVSVLSICLIFLLLSKLVNLVLFLVNVVSSSVWLDRFFELGILIFFDIFVIGFNVNCFILFIYFFKFVYKFN